MRNIFCIVFILTVLSCSRDEPEPQFNQFDNSVFTKYVERFVEEASKRELKGPTAVTFDKAISNLEIRFDDELVRGAGARAISSNPNNPLIVWSTDPGNWALLDKAGREAFVFHELGHAILQRSHSNLKLPNGDFKSLMIATGPEGHVVDLYEMGSERRTYYIDELFNSGTPVPDWAK